MPKKDNQYLLKFYVHARHYVRLEDTSTETHPHTWEFGLYIAKGLDDKHPFKEVEDLVENFFGKYENQLINEVPPFHLLNPSMENMGKVLYRELSELLKQERSLTLHSLEISENPTRTYIVTQYETYFQDIRKEIEKDMQRFKQEHGIPEPSFKSITTLPLKASKVEKQTLSRLNKQQEKEQETKSEINWESVVPLQTRKGKKKRNKIKIFKFLTGLIAIGAVLLLILYRATL